MTTDLRTKARAFRGAQRTVTFDGLHGEPPPSVPGQLRTKFATAREELLSHARQLARDAAERSRRAEESTRHALGELATVRSPSPATIDRAAFRMLRGWLEACRNVQRSRTFARGEPFPPKLSRALTAMLDAYDCAVAAGLSGADQLRTEISAAGGRARALTVRAETGERDRKIRERARQLQADGRSRREIPGILASAFGLSARRIRDILKAR